MTDTHPADWQRAENCASGNCVEVKYIKASQCSGGSCVEVGHVADGVLIRDSKHPDRPPLHFTTDEWQAFVDGVNAGEFRF